MIRLFAVVIALALLAGPASADPISGAVAGWVTSALGGGAFATAVGAFAGRLAAAKVFSLLSGVGRRSQEQQQTGIKTSVTLSGGTNSQSFPLGRCALGGSLIYPVLGHSIGGLPNEYLVFVINLSDLPGATLEEVFVNGEKITLGGDPHPDYGVPAGGDYEGRLWVKYYDGSQTAADPMMLAKYGNDPDFPWSADMIGRDTCLAYITAKRDPDFWGSGLPSFRFAMLGIPVYDVRKDSTAGGSGTHRLDDKSTWEQTENLAANTAAVFRGIEMPTGEIWGGRSSNLPVTVWAAAMNECDVAIPLAAGGTEAQYRGGLEVLVDQKPKEIVDKFLTGCFGQVADVGGEWNIQVGAAPLPVYFFTDGDIVVTDEQGLDPFPTLQDTINGVSARHPSPENGWEYTDAPAFLNPDLEAEDLDQRLLKDLVLDAVPYSLQAQRLQAAYGNDARRFRRAQMVLPPDAVSVNPLNTVAWTSEKYGFSAKLFGVSTTEKSLVSLLNSIGIRERDPDDGGDWTTGDEQPTFSPGPTRTSPDPLVLPGFGVGPIVRSGDNGSGARPGIEIIYTQISVSSIFWRVRVKATEALVGEGAVPNAGTGRATLPFDALPATTYQVQALVNLTGQTAWTSWLDVTTDDIRVGAQDIDPAVFDAIEQDTANAINQFETRSVVPVIRQQEDLAEQASLEMANAFAEELRQRDELVANADAIASEAVARAQAILAESEARQQGDDAINVTIAALSTTVADNAAAIVQEAVARAGQDDALAADIAAILVTTAQNAAAIVTEQTARADGDTANANAISALGVTVGQNTADISAEQTARADADAVLASDIASLQAATAANAAAITTEQTARTNADSAIASDVAALTTSVGDNTAAIGAEQTARTAQDAALAADIAALTVTVGSNTSDIATEQTTRASEDAALAASIAALTTTVDGNTAAITAETSARVAADLVQTNDLAAYISANDAAVASANSNISTLVSDNTAQASSIAALLATTNGHTTTISQQATAIAGMGATVQTTLNVNDHITGWALTSEVLAGGAVYSDFVFVADAFRIAGTGGNPMTPFAVYTAPRDINGVTVPAGTFFEGMMTTQNLRVTDQLSAVFAEIGHFKSAPSGERVEIKDDRFSVFDANEVERVRLGRLS